MVAVQQNENSEERWIWTHEIVADPRCQPRATIDDQLVTEYAEAMAGGEVFPAVEVFFDRDTHWLADGFHRFAAARRAGVRQILAVVTQGDVWDAIERSCAVNADHGLRRSNADKRRAVETMFAVMQHRSENWSDSEIARRCGVHHSTASAVRVSILPNPQDAGRRLVERGGRTFEMDTTRIGRPALPRVWEQVTAEPPPLFAVVDLETGEIVRQPDEPDDIEPAPPPSISPEAREQLVAYERRIGQRLVVGETLADCGKRLSLCRGELGELVKDLGRDIVRRELGQNMDLSHRWAEVINLAGEIERFARDVVAIESEVIA